MDLGIQIHAIRMLPLYCPDTPACAPGAAVHDTLFTIVNGYLAQLGLTPPVQLAATDLLRLRAAVEAIGATHSALPVDADLLLSHGLIDHDSRDVRVTVVRALRGLNSCTAVNPLKVRLVTDPSPQVRAAIHTALQALQCPS
jgi:HEAT repeat protein